MYRGVSRVKQEESSLVAKTGNLDIPGGLSSIRGFGIYGAHSSSIITQLLFLNEDCCTVKVSNTIESTKI